jgi:hypothetical protein
MQHILPNSLSVSTGCGSRHAAGGGSRRHRRRTPGLSQSPGRSTAQIAQLNAATRVERPAQRTRSGATKVGRQVGSLLTPAIQILIVHRNRLGASSGAASSSSRCSRDTAAFEPLMRSQHPGFDPCSGNPRKFYRTNRDCIRLAPAAASQMASDRRRIYPIGPHVTHPQWTGRGPHLESANLVAQVWILPSRGLSRAPVC